MFGVPVLALVNDGWRFSSVWGDRLSPHASSPLLEEQAAPRSDQPAADGGRPHPGGGGGDRRRRRRETLQIDLPPIRWWLAYSQDVHIRAATPAHLGDKVILIGRPASFGEALRAVAGEEA